MQKKLLLLQTVLLTGGVLVSWQATLVLMRNFINGYGTLFHFADCSIPNPLLTACFYGALAFLAAFGWSLWLALSTRVSIGERYLKYFLLFGVVFALSVLGYETLEYYKLFSFGGNIITCSPGTPPYRTPCFYGMMFFLASYIVAFTATKGIFMKSPSK